MILRQFLHTEPVVAASYIVGCGGKSACVVIDPVHAPELYLRAAADLGMTIRYVIDTGTARISRYSPKSKLQRLPIESGFSLSRPVSA